LNPEALRPASYIPTVSGLPDSGACELKGSKSIVGYSIPLPTFPMSYLHPARREFHIQNWGVPHPTRNQKVDPQYAGLLLHKLPSVRRICAFYSVEALRRLLIYKFGP